MTRARRAGYARVVSSRALSILALLVLAAPACAAEPGRTEAAGLRFGVPSAWARVPAPSDVRAAQWRIPRAGSDAEDGELVLFHFGKGKGGSAEENLERWYGQFTEPDGRPAKDAAVVTIRTVRGLRVTEVDLPGTYTGAGMGGPPPGPKPGSRLLGAVIEGGDGPWFFRAIGPDATVAAARADFEALLASVDAHH